jgi:hypothetical protein
MSTGEGTPWVPERLDQYLDQPFDEIQERINESVLQRLERMERQLNIIEADLDQLLEQHEMSFR